ncbi:MAG: PilZ domain-containing protein [Desulfobacteraceae bacterium]|jgi:Tfp pilus assembly protein PilZ
MNTLRKEYRKLNIAEAVVEYVRSMPEEEQDVLLRDLFEEELEGRGERVFKRIPVFVAANYVVDGRAYQDFVRNVGAGGVFIETPEHFSVGQKVSLTFSLPNDPRVIKITGEIIRTTPKGVGIEFKVAERRKWERFDVSEPLLAVIDDPFPQLGEITDISEDGLAFRYSANKSLLKGLSQLDVFLVKSRSGMRDLAVDPRWEMKISGKMRKQGVQFRGLSDKQKSQLTNVLEQSTLYGDG